MMQRLEYMKCETCMFFVANNVPEGAPIMGVCRRFPPQVSVLSINHHVQAVQAWPEVTAVDMCGEWKADQPTQKKVYQKAALAGMDIPGMKA